MGKIIGTKPLDECSKEGKANELISIVEAKAYAVAYWDAEGKRSTCLVYHFGKLDDGKDGIFLFANQQQMQDTLRILHEPMLEQVRSELAGQREVSPKDVTAKAGDKSIAAALAGGAK